MDEQTTVEVGPEQLASLVEAGDSAEIAAFLDGLEALEEVRLVSRLEDAQRDRLLELVPPPMAADLLLRLPEPLTASSVERIPTRAATSIVEAMPSNEKADLLGSMSIEAAAAILDQLSETEAQDVRRLASYDENVAGGLMITEYLQFRESAIVAEVIEDLGVNADRYGHFDIQYAFVTDAQDRLTGVLRMRDLLLSGRTRQLTDLMIPDPLSVRDDMPLEELLGFFDDHRFVGAPVVDSEGRLVGVVRRSAVEEASAEDSDRMYRRSQGIVGGEELRTMPLLTRSRRRLSWLSVNIVLNLIAASVIAMHTETLEAVVILAVFLPIISDMSGCSGNQAVAVSMRELTLGVMRPTELKRAIFGEVFLGMLNGAALGLLIGMVAWVWQQQPYLGLVVGAALMLNTIIAVVIGGSVPLLLKRIKVDPALAASPILTTVTDMCGFFILLSIASSMLDKLT